MNKQKQLDNLLDHIKKCLVDGNFHESRHCEERRDERIVSLPDIVYVLSQGYHEKQKSSFDSSFNTWKYAIRGKTVDKRDLRIIIAFSDDGMLIITVVRLK